MEPPRFDETISIDVLCSKGRAFRRRFVFCLTPSLIFFWPLVIAGWIDGEFNLPTARIGLLFVAVLGSFVAFLFSLPVLLLKPHDVFPYSLRLRGTRFAIETPTDAWEADISRWWWSEGDPCAEPIASYIDKPRVVLLWYSRNRAIPCGISEDGFKALAAMLPQLGIRKSSLGWPILFSLVVTICGGPILSRLLVPTVLRLTGNPAWTSLRLSSFVFALVLSIGIAFDLRRVRKSIIVGLALSPLTAAGIAAALRAGANPNALVACVALHMGAATLAAITILAWQFRPRG